MSLFNIMPVFARKNEEETVELMKKHGEMTASVVAEFKNAYSLFVRKDFRGVEEKVNLVSSLESKADDLRREIEEKMYSGAFLPGSRSMILNFAERVDEVADAAQDAARILLFLEERQIPDDILTLMSIEVDDALNSVETLQKSISDMSNAEEVKSAIVLVREKEHDSDEIETKAYSALYKKVKDPITVLLTSKLIAYTGNISNRAEDATDVLSLILLLHEA